MNTSASPRCSTLMGFRIAQLLHRTVRALGHRPDAEALPRRRGANEADPPCGNNWPIGPEQAERLFMHAPFTLLTIAPTSHGVAGAQKATMAFPDDDLRLQVKWKVAPHRKLDGWNNNPRKELATYVVQRWFLDPRDYVVPTVAVRAVPLAAYQRLDPKARPTVDGMECVVGTVALWLQHTIEPEPLYDPARFATDAAYAYHFSNLNVLTYLVAHRDGRPGNILAADTDSNRRVFAVDNGISFGGMIYNFLTTNWDVLRVGAVRREVVERLRTVDAVALGALATLVELEVGDDGMLRSVAAGPPIDPQCGARVASDRIQLGLTTAEIDGLGERIAVLLRRIDEGSLAQF